MSGERIMVVEDESILAMLIKRKLQNWGYEVVDWVDTGEDAVKNAEKYEPDLILMDIVLKGDMDGIEAAQRIRENVDIPIIYLTAYSNDEVLKRAQETEPYGYILKPFREGEVNANIKMALYKHNSEKKRRDAIKKRVLTDFYDLVQKSMNDYGDYSDDDIKETLLNIFSQRIEEELPSFDDKMEELGLNYETDDIKDIFEAYLNYLSDLLLGFGIRSKTDYDKEGYRINFLNCPWKTEAEKKPIFCLNCQAIINHSLNWTNIEGKMDRDKTIAEGSPICIFQLY
ncbi:MAG: methanogen output domain 1-containing protein [Methanobacterium sp.]|jgi:CheY-like chemotaxis protein|nr:methanogen output domain 1-containing protein [Methanobacterium sp.]